MNYSITYLVIEFDEKDNGNFQDKRKLSMEKGSV